MACIRGRTLGTGETASVASKMATSRKSFRLSYQDSLSLKVCTGGWKVYKFLFGTSNSLMDFVVLAQTGPTN